MSELLALSFDADASPSIRLRTALTDPTPEQADARSAIYGWGIGWYPGSEGGASVVKDPTSAGDGSVQDALRDWSRFRSTLFVCHLRGHRRPRRQEDAQPFVRSYGGRQWTFAHDGDLAADYAERFPLDGDPAFEPLGRTDSEHAFCWLLAQLRELRARSLADVDPERLRGWLVALNEGGRVNTLIADGETLAVYGDAKGSGRLHWTRRLPPHPETALETGSVRVALDSPLDPHRTALVFASAPGHGETWQPLADAELVLARRGAITWDSAPREAATRRRPARDAVAPASRQATGTQRAAALPAALGASRPELAERTLSVLHETRYRYEEAVERSAHRLLLRPLEDAHQQLLAYTLEVEPQARTEAFEDVFGNACVGLEIRGPYRELRITSRARVRVRAPGPIEQRLAGRRHAIPLSWMPWQRQMLTAYLLPPELAESELRELSEYAMSFVERNRSDLAGTLLDLNETLYRDFEYVSGSTTVETTAYEVFASRRGVCQDFANLMICLAQLLQVPARYRMGYIHTGADYTNRIQSDASHAWVELYVPRVGWCGFDPTNGRQVGSDHVRVACGRHYRDATPTSGTLYRGGGGESLAVTVRVEPLEERA